MEVGTSGYGSGYGDGDGYGGYGDGDGYGSGYGDGYGLLTEAYTDHPSIPKDKSVTLGFWRSDAQGYSANGGTRSGEPARPGLVQEVPGPLKLCTRHALHASLNPGQWQGERWWVVALIGEVQSDGQKMGALQRLIIDELV